MSHESPHFSTTIPERIHVQGNSCHAQSSHAHVHHLHKEWNTPNRNLVPNSSCHIFLLGRIHGKVEGIKVSNSQSGSQLNPTPLNWRNPQNPSKKYKSSTFHDDFYLTCLVSFLVGNAIESIHGEVKCRWAYDGNGKIDGCDGMDDGYNLPFTNPWS